MKPHTLVAIAAFLTGCTSSTNIDQRAENTLRNTMRQAVTLQREMKLTWDEAAAQVIQQLPGGGRELALADGVITYQTDELCLGAWIDNLTDIVIAPCIDIDWGTDRVWPGGRSDCFTE